MRNSAKLVSLVVIIIALTFFSQLQFVGGKDAKANNNYLMTGVASWYGKYFHGRETASGEPFNMYNYTAAHRSLPLGTKVRVINPENGKSVIVQINDRGPYVEGRTIDLSYAAAKSIGIVEDGTSKVKIEIISKPNA